jgi:L-asparaginase
VRDSEDRPPVVAVLGTGGTITAWCEDALDMTGYTEGGRRLELSEVIAAVPDARRVARLQEHPLPSSPSHDLRIADLCDVADAVERAAAAEETCGVVVMHGTNALEELAFLLSLVIRTEKPVVVTGAMRPLSGLSGDGPLNFVDAVRTAAASQARGHGVLAVLDGDIWAAGDVTKARTFGTHAFSGGRAGPLGFCGPDGSVTLWRRAAGVGPHLALPDRDALPRVDVLLSYLGADGALVDAAVAAGARGLVSAGTGAGFPSTAELGALRRAAAGGVVVCQSSRAPEGLVVPSPRLSRDGFLAARWLTPVKCQIVLALCLADGRSAEQVQDVVDQLAGAVFPAGR